MYAGDDGSAATQVDASNVSVCSDEGLDVSQQFVETVFAGSSLDSDAEDIVSGRNYHFAGFCILGFIIFSIEWT